MGKAERRGREEERRRGGEEERKRGREEERKREREEGRAELMFYLQEVVKAYNSRKGFDFSGLHDFFDSEVFHTISYHHISILF